VHLLCARETNSNKQVERIKNYRIELLNISKQVLIPYSDAYKKALNRYVEATKKRLRKGIIRENERAP
jgi:hypothetical protein